MANCGCSSRGCSCVLVAGDGVTIEGSGSAGTPYVISASGGDVGCSCEVTAGDGITVTGDGSSGTPFVVSASTGACPAPMTIAELVALRDAAGLDVCATYTVTDWVTANSLPGPNLLLARATAADALSPSVLIQTPFGILGPDRGEYAWDLGFMISAADPLGNEILDIANVTIDAFVWGGAWQDNKLEDVDFTGGYAVTSAASAAGFNIGGTRALPGSTIDLTGATFGAILLCEIQGQATVTSGAQMLLQYSAIGTGCTITNAGSGLLSITDSRVTGSGAQVDTTGSTGATTILRSEIAGSDTGTSIINLGSGDLTVSDSRVIAHSFVVANSTADLIIEYSLLEFGTVDNSGTDRRVDVDRTRVAHNSNITVDITAALAFAGTYRFLRCELVDGDINVTGVAGENDLHFDDVFVLGGSIINATNPSGDVSVLVVDTSSILNVNGGEIIASKIGLEAVVNTGAFAHDAVNIQAPGTVTLTAPNSNTYKGFGASTVV